VLEATKQLASIRGTAAVVVDPAFSMVGIMTDTDFTRRVAAKSRDVLSTILSEVMTPNPTSVSVTDPATDALMMMIENRYRHLPVVDEKGVVCGVLDIGKCLDDAITRLERAEEKNSKSSGDALMQVANLQGAGDAQVAALQALLSPLMSQALGEKRLPTLRSVLSGRPRTMIDPNATVLEAAEKMSESRKAALVVEDGKLVGILSFKDVMSRVISKELPLSSTLVSSVMTPSPEFVSPDSTVLEALQVMHDNKFLTLPVCEADGRVVGLVDVMDVIYGCGGAEGWRSIFDNAIELDDSSDQQSGTQPVTTSVAQVQVPKDPVIHVNTDTPFVSNVPGHIPQTVEIGGAENDSFGYPAHTETSFDIVTERDIYVFKVVDPSGNTHRVRCERKRSKLVDALLPKLGGKVDPSKLQIQFTDDEGDAVIITNDDDLVEASNLARTGAKDVIKLTVSIAGGKSIAETLEEDPVLLGGVAGAVVLGVLLIGLALARPRRN